jgi:hypothetical protein
MEKHNMVHNCGLWVSMDSPHEGAVLSIGLQNFVKEMSSYNEKAKEMLNNQINVPAARQQLIHHHLANSESPQGSPGFFNRYYDFINGVGWDADGKGWPQLPRRVALNSGAHNGLEQLGSSCSPAVWLKIRPRNWVRVLFTTTIGTRVESTIKFSPSSSDGRCQVLDFKLKTIVGDVSRPSYAAHSGIYDKSLELLPGGWYPGFKELYDNLSVGGWGWAIKVEKEMYVENHTHIPTASALAYGKGPNPNPNRKWDDDIRSVNLGLTCGTGEIPFNSYQGPLDFNTRHDLLFETQAKFLTDEITGVTSIPGLVISGQTNVCNNRPSYFTVNLPSGGSAVWNSSPSGKVTLTL